MRRDLQAFKALATEALKKKGKAIIEHKVSPDEKPSPSTNLAAQRASLGYKDQHLLVWNSDEGRTDERNSPEQRDENLSRKAGEQYVNSSTSTPTAADLLAPHHETMLREKSCISSEVIAARGYTTVYEPEELEKMGFDEYQLRVPALAIPIFDVWGEFRFHRIRPDNPRPDWSKPNKLVKYDQPPETPLVLDVPPAALEGLRDTSRRLWIVEGEKKADALVSQGECAVALHGVWAWKREGYPLADWDQIPMIGREVRILFDSDTTDKVEVRHALYALSRFLRGKVHGS